MLYHFMHKRIVVLVVVGALIVLLVSLVFLKNIPLFHIKQVSPTTPKHSTLYLISQKGNQFFLHIIRARDGKELAVHPLPGTPDGLFLSDQSMLYSTEPGVLYALKVDGRVLWKHEFTEQNTFLNTVQYDAIYVQSARTLYVLNKKDGTLRWQHTFDYDIENISITPKKVFVTVIPLPDTRTIYALNSLDGDVIWHFTAPHPSLANPFVSDNIVFFSSTSGVYALQSDNGAKIWYHEGQTYVSEPKAVVNGIAFFSNFLNPNETVNSFSSHSHFPGEASIRKPQDVTGFIRALRVSDNTEIWHYPCDENCEFGLLRVINGVVYDPTGPHLIALRASDGKLIWSYQCAKLCDEANVTLDGIYIYQDTTPYDLSTGVPVPVPTPASRSGFVEQLNSNSGHVLWHDNFNTSPLDISLEDNGLLYVQASRASELYVLQANDGDILWHEDFKDEISLLQVFDL